MRPPRAEEYLPLLDAHPGLVRWMTLAPEVPGALELLALRQRGVVAPPATATPPNQRSSALDAGLSHATHLYCAMSTISSKGPTASPDCWRRRWP